jgi:hypothetical protein
MHRQAIKKCKRYKNKINREEGGVNGYLYAYVLVNVVIVFTAFVCSMSVVNKNGR